MSDNGMEKSREGVIAYLEGILKLLRTDNKEMPFTFTVHHSRGVNLIPHTPTTGLAQPGVPKGLLYPSMEFTMKIGE